MNQKEYSVRYKAWGTAIVAVILLTTADQFTKYMAVHYLKGSSSVSIIPHVLQLSYLENRGIAWGMFGGGRWAFLLFTLLIVLGIVYLWRIVPFQRKYTAFRVLSVIFLSGALGNAIDRLFRGFVVDFFDFYLIHFPVFNVADCFVCVALIWIVILYRNEDFAWMNKS